MTDFYSEDLLRRTRARARNARLAGWGAILGGLAACVILCTQVRTGNAQRLLTWTVGISTAAGWAAMALLLGVCQPAAALASHMTGIREEPVQTLEGELRLSPLTRQLPRSIAVRPATLTDAEGERLLSVRADCAGALRGAERVRVRVARSYIIGFEVLP